MARSLDAVLTAASADDIGEQRERRLAKSTGRAFAAAISSLIIATLVVTTSAETLRQEGTVSGNSFETGTITLVDDDQGRSLVRLDNMGPERPVERCIRISYEGTILPVELTLVASTTGELARYLRVEIEKGTGAGFDSCVGFQPTEATYTGTLSELAARDAIPVGTIRNEGASASFRFRFEVLDERQAVGRSSTADFVWEAIPS